MGVCVPKHIVCDWYTPNFTASNTGCTLTGVANLFRARAFASFGDIFFRSIAYGTDGNSIQVTGTWQVEMGSPPVGVPSGWRDYDEGAPYNDVPTDVVAVKLVVSDGATTETYYAEQTTLDLGSPRTWTGSSILSLQTQISNNSILVTIPNSDGISGWTGPTADSVEREFTVTLSGGDGPATTPSYLDSLRTGPVHSMIYAQNSEDSNGAADTNVVFYWNGAFWKTYDSINPDCEDPDNPVGCALGPESDP